MSLVPFDSQKLWKFYLPHHCVLSEDSTTTKLRAVFNGSLNEILMAGPIFQLKPFHTLLQFRTLPVALSGNICNMYRCARVKEPGLSWWQTEALVVGL